MPNIKDSTPELTTEYTFLFNSQTLQNQSFTKTSPQEDSPQLMSPNNVRLTDNNLFGYKNRGEGVSKEVGNKSDGHFGNKNSDFSGVNDISNLLEMISPRKYNLSAGTEWDLREKYSAKRYMTRRAKEVESVMKVLSGNNLPQVSEMVLYVINKHPLLRKAISSYANNLSDLIVGSLQGFFSNLASSGTRTTAEKNAVHTIVTVCTRGINKTEINEVRDLLGSSKRYWYEYEPLPDQDRYQHKARKRRKVC